ncbi:MAG: membrane protein insertion efficiency factor YidD [Candidatus Peribacteraceae bacterium]|nr:membrane protein insertion efficiency factor YidD [Candidatus Peribacteraceae bacterium]MBP9850130.1 membrane protein insertion efficiency factor YidD [Candidatus Peribacteraceae bacterium]
MYTQESYSMTSAFRKALATVCGLPATISVALVRVYQYTLSPDHGPLRHLYPHGFCRHEPTCSQFAIETLRIRRYPVAIFLIIRRILSCNPWKTPDDERLRACIRRH